MKKIRFYAPMYLLAAGLTFMSPSIKAYAEGELEGQEVQLDEQNAAAQEAEGQEVQLDEQNAAAAQEEEEVLYEETEGEYELEEIEGQNEKTAEQIAAEEQAAKEAEAKELQEAEAAKAKQQEILDQQAALDAIIGSNTIDAADQSYNTGRKEIPASVQTEAERKGIQPITPETPSETPGTPSETPGTPSTGTPDTGTPNTEIIITIIPKTGLDFKAILCGGFGIGLGLAALNSMRGPSIYKVEKSKKAFRKKRQKKLSK